MQQGEKLIQRNHESSETIQAQVNSLIQQWNDLIQASASRGKGLEEAKDILKFQEEVDKVEAWIRDKELLVAAGDMGRDYEHCLELQKKVNDVEGVSSRTIILFMLEKARKSDLFREVIYSLDLLKDWAGQE